MRTRVSSHHCSHRHPLWLPPAITSAVVFALLTLSPLATSAAAAAPSSTDPDLAAVERSSVSVSSAWLSGRGVLVGDGRTALIPCPALDAGRALSVRPAGGGQAASASARRYGHGATELFVLSLDRPIRATPLPLAARVPDVGEAVFMLLPRPDGGHELGQARVTLASEHTLALGSPAALSEPGSAVVNSQGQLIGLVVGDGLIARVPASLRPDATEPRGLALTPVSGLRLGATLDGALGDTFSVDGDLGLTIADRWSAVMRVGVLAPSGPYRQPLAATAGLGAGYSERDRYALRFGLEGRYRLALSGGALPTYLNLALGVSLTSVISAPHGLAQRSTDLTCDPLLGECPLQPTSGAPRSDSSESLGVSVGLDLQLGFVTLGYRLQPAALGSNPADIHELTLGFGLF